MKQIFISALLSLALMGGCGGQPSSSLPSASRSENAPAPQSLASAAEETLPASLSETSAPVVPEPAPAENTAKQMVVQNGERTMVFALNDSAAANALYEQLPLELEVENFSSNEKIFYPPDKLDCADAPIAEGGEGVLAYYEPWGDVVMFYGDFSSGSGLYGLGEAVSGAEHIPNLSGILQITAGPAETGSAAPKQEEREGDTENTMKIQVGNETLYAELTDNSSAQALKELLAQGPLTIQMSDYGDMEKVGPIGQSLPRNDRQITTGPGDIILYQGSSLVIYYDINSWNFTPIGKIGDATREALLDVLGSGNVSVTFSLGE